MPDNRSTIYQLLEQLGTQSIAIRLNASTFNDAEAETAVAIASGLIAQIDSQLQTNMQVNTGQLQVVEWQGSPELPVATQGQPYTFQFTAEGGVTPYRWFLAAGGWPAGITLDPNTGILSGTCLAFPGGDFDGVVDVVDAVASQFQTAWDIRIAP